MKKMATIVDQQNKNDPNYKKMSDDFDPEVLRELEENFRMISATAGALSGTLDKLNVGAGGQSQSQREETNARKENTSSINAQMRVQEAAAKATAEMAERQKNFSEASAKSTDALVGLTTAMIDGEATVKTFSRKNGHIWLLPANPSFEPINGDNCEILGKVTAVMRSVR